MAGDIPQLFSTRRFHNLTDDNLDSEDGCLGKREIDCKELLVVEPYPAVLVLVEPHKGLCELLDKHACTYEAVERDSRLIRRLDRKSVV